MQRFRKIVVPEVTTRTSFIFILLFTTIIVFDSTIVKFTSYSGVELKIGLNVAIFIIFFITFVSSNIILLYSVRGIISSHESKTTIFGFKYFFSIISATQIVTAAIMLIIILQMSFLSKYDIVLLRAETYLSHICSFIFLACLVFLFANWLTSKKNLGMILYMLSFSLASVNLLLSLLYLDSYFSASSISDIIPLPITAYVTNQPGLPVTELSSMIFDAISLSSFLLMWVATAIFLSKYRTKLARIKFFLIISIPLIYYIFPLQGYFEDIFFSLLQSSPVSYSIAYIIIFSATKQVGALLFSLAFWIASTLVYDMRTRKSLLVTSIGMAILFSTLELSPLSIHVYPPYGFVTQAFIPLGSYLLFIGIFTSAKNISRDSELRKEFYKSAASQLGLLKAIGVTEMEKELERRLNIARKSAKSFEQEDAATEEENAKEILREVLNELYYSKLGNRRIRGT